MINQMEADKMLINKASKIYWHTLTTDYLSYSNNPISTKFWNVLAMYNFQNCTKWYKKIASFLHEHVDSSLKIETKIEIDISVHVW